MNKPYGWVDEINTFVLDKDYRQLPKSLQNGMTPLYANKVPDGLIDPKSFYEGYENGKKSQRAKLENRLGRTTVIKSLEYKSSPPNTKKGTREMNAYELADEAKRQSQLIYLATEERVAEQLSTMFNNYSNMLRQQADRIAELEKKSKPVAWMSPDGKVSQTQGRLFYIPLYTTPQTKPLSDEEIETIYLKTLNKFEFARAIEERHGIK